MRLVRVLDAVAAGPVREVLLDDGSRAFLWPGVPPRWTPPPHPGLGRRGGAVRVGGEPHWLELRPEGALLSDLLWPIPPEEAALVGLRVAEALAALHAAGRAHGDLRGERVVLGVGGEVVLCGAGVVPGTAATDLTELARLLDALGGGVLEMGDLADAAEAVEALRAHAGGRAVPAEELGALAEAVAPAPPGDAPVLDAEPLPAGTLDEVGVDIGPDEGGRGLLDPPALTGTATGAEGERTGTAPGVDDLVAALGEVAAALEEPAPRPAREGEPSEAVKARIADEPLDPMPSPSGALAPAWHELDASGERTAEVTAVGPGEPDLLERPTAVEPPPPRPRRPRRRARPLALAALGGATFLLAAVLLARACGVGP